MIKTPDLKKYLDKRKIEIEKKTILKILNKENTPLVKKKKLKDIFISKYGVDNPGKDQSVKDKIRRTNLERFGETSWMKVEENKKKI